MQSTQLSLIAFYGPKPGPLQALLRSCQQQVIAILGNRFRPYDMLQSHATIISLERAPHTERDNRFFHEYRGKSRPMDFAGLLKFLRSDTRIPLQVRFGGWALEETPFTSRDGSPYQRSFTVQGNKTVLMGWPVSDQGYTTTLNDLRHDLKQFNLLHKYFHQPGQTDNDCYLRLGLLSGAALPDQQREQVEYILRGYLAARPPLRVDMTLRDLVVAAYIDEPLTYRTTRYWSLNDPQLTPEFLAGLYERKFD